MTAKSTAHGRIFAVPLPDGTYIFGRVLLDVAAVWRRRLLPHDSPILYAKDTCLIEMYSAVVPTLDYEPSPALYFTVFVEAREIGKSWPVVGYMPVDPKTVAFPETLIGAGRGASFECGEIRVSLPLTEAEIGRIDQYKSSSSVFLWPFSCLRLLGREAEIPEIAEVNSVLGHDLRISPYRARIYQHLPFCMEQSYFEKQAMLGLHFERLYE